VTFARATPGGKASYHININLTLII